MGEGALSHRRGNGSEIVPDTDLKERGSSGLFTLVAEVLFAVWVIGALVHYYHSMGFGQFLLGLFGD